MTGIAIKQSQINKKLCTTCHRSKLNQEDMDKYLPVWYDKKGKVQYQLSLQLQGLHEGEKLMLQQVSPYVPLIHLKDCQIGSRGHVCSFVQEISEICTVLPRLPDDIQFVKVVKQFHKEGGEIGSKTFTIRKKAVLDALKWLKEYNIDYKDIEIKESNLDWIEDGVSQELPPSIIQMDYNDVTNNSPSSVDLGPSEVQTLSGLQCDSPETSELETVLGILPSPDQHLPKKKDVPVIHKLNEELDKHNKKNHTAVKFPYISPKPITEFDVGNSLFTKAFPWLFPGGYGDFGQQKELTLNVSDWARSMLYYQDGRFAKDRIWCFFALDFATRRKNQTQGGFFVDGFFKEGPKTLDELQEEIENGNTRWIDRICYFSGRVAGSADYWRAKRAEVYTWINHHI